MSLSRRELTALSLAAVGSASLAACSTTLPGATEGPARPSTSPSTTPAPSRDDELVREALDDELLLLAQLRAARRRHRSLRPRAEVAIEVHRRHVDLLTEAAPDHVPSVLRPDVPGQAGRARAAIARSEAALVRAHTERAVAAASGPLARLLAGMAAGAAQQELLLRSGARR